MEPHLQNGIADPIAHFQKQVDKLNQLHKRERTQKIGDVSPLLYPGYFPLSCILNQLGVRKNIDLFHLVNEMQFDLYESMSTLIYARAVHPCSKNKTYQVMIPNLLTQSGFSYDQLLDGLSFLGANYQKFVEIFTEQTEEMFGSDTTTACFDRAIFFFEIDREDDFRRNGPRKESRKAPVIGLGLLTDGNQIPIGMKMYFGNESEKPAMRNVIDELKKRRQIAERTIHVTDQGLNYAAYIAHAKQNGDGYIFSKSVNSAPEMEKTWALLNADYQEVRDKKGNILYAYKSCVDEFPYTTEYEGKSITVRLKEKRLVTYNPSLAAKSDSRFFARLKKRERWRFLERKARIRRSREVYSIYRSGREEGIRQDQ